MTSKVYLTQTLTLPGEGLMTNHGNIYIFIVFNKSRQKGQIENVYITLRATHTRAPLSSPHSPLLQYIQLLIELSTDTVWKRMCTSGRTVVKHNEDQEN